MSEKNNKLTIDPLWGKLYPLGLKKGDRRKAEIIEAVVAQSAESGIESLSYETIGQRTRMTKSQVLYHVGSRDDMICRSYEHILYHAQQILVTHLARSKPGLDRLLAYVRGNFSWLTQKPDQVKFFIQVYSFAIYNTQIREINNRARDGGRERTIAILQEADLKIGPQKLKMWGNLFYDQLTGALLEIVISGKATDAEHIRSRLQALEVSIRYTWRAMMDRRQSDTR